MSPVQKHCTLSPHEEATLPSWLPLPWRSPLPLPSPSPTPTLLSSPSPLPLQSPIAVAAAMGHCCGCREPLPPPSLSRCRQPSLLPSPLPMDTAISVLAIAVAIAVGHHRRHAVDHFRELLPWRGKNCIQSIEAKNAHLILFCWDSGRCFDRSRITYQVSSGDGQHQRWAVSGKQ